MKIALIGPVYPYKGGIAHYTSLLCKALREKNSVKMISYKMQYPKLLFKKEQKDFSNDSFKIEDTEYWLNTANPFNWIKTAMQLNRHDSEVLLIQWWHPYFAPCYYALAKLCKRKKIVFTCHNVFPHERFPLDRMLTKLVLKLGDGFIVHSRADAEELLTIKKEANYVVTPHPTYNAFRLTGMSRGEARELLKVSEETPMLLFFGFVRKYKGLTYLLEAMPQILSKLPDIQLWIVGDFGEDRAEYSKLIEERELEKNIRLVEGYIPDKEVEKYFAASDLVVLPYVSATQSGIIQIAYGFDKPVIATRVGGLPDVVEDGNTGYLVPPENSNAIAEQVIRFFTKDANKNWSTNIAKKEEEFSWERMADRFAKLCESTDGTTNENYR